mmetsp:Transcript_41048/g.118877  ORF Transcript_41048/g.118877 Transcript_41048/m.118877 type:complete len:281 (+) Transcript_41048:275-1117(+)
MVRSIQTARLSMSTSTRLPSAPSACLAASARRGSTSPPVLQTALTLMKMRVKSCWTTLLASTTTTISGTCPIPVARSKRPLGSFPRKQSAGTTRSTTLRQTRAPAPIFGTGNWTRKSAPSASRRRGNCSRKSSLSSRSTWRSPRASSICTTMANLSGTSTTPMRLTQNGGRREWRGSQSTRGHSAIRQVAVSSERRRQTRKFMPGRSLGGRNCVEPMWGSLAWAALAILLERPVRCALRNFTAVRRATSPKGGLRAPPDNAVAPRQADDCGLRHSWPLRT